MRLAISNIAWDVEEDEAVAALLARHEVDAIDVAPGKYFPEPAEATDDDIRRVRRWWADRGIEITGMQALLFGTTGLNVFGPAEVQDALIARLTEVMRIGAGLGSPRIVFGSPKNRDRAGLDDQETRDIARAFFRRVGVVADAYGVTMCLEPNPTHYGANFMTTSTETSAVVSDVASPAIRMQLDTGAVTINGEDVKAVLADASTLIGHIHASEPDLVPLGDGATDHRVMASAIQEHLADHVVTIEMVATRDEPHLEAIGRALVVADKNYRLVGVA